MRIKERKKNFNIRTVKWNNKMNKKIKKMMKKLKGKKLKKSNQYNNNNNLDLDWKNVMKSNLNKSS